MKKRFISCIMLTAMLTVGAQAQDFMTTEERDVYNTYKEEVTAFARIAGEDAYNEILMKYNVPKAQRKPLAYVIREREQRKAAYNYIHKSSPTLRAQAKIRMDSTFQNAVDSILIPYNKLSGENITYMLRRSQTFKLDQAQYDKLMNVALSMCRRIREDRNTDVWDEEMKVLKETLGKKTFNSFLIQRNARTVTDRMKAAWEKMENAGLTEELDSASQCAHLYMFFMEQEKVKFVYKNLPNERKKLLAEVDKGMPNIAKIYYAMIKRERDEKKKETEATKGFVW